MQSLRVTVYVVLYSYGESSITNKPTSTCVTINLYILELVEAIEVLCMYKRVVDAVVLKKNCRGIIVLGISPKDHMICKKRSCKILFQ